MRSGFFENTAVMAEDFARFARGLLTNGVLADTATALKVTPGSGMRVNVAPGYCWINGHFGVSDTSETLSIESSDGTLGRMDRVVARLDIGTNEIRLEVITGEASESPAPPNVVRSGNYYDLGLAIVNVPAGTLEITQLNLTDTRSDAEVCGAVIYRNADSMALDGKANKSDLINPYSLPYRNLGDAFESEIAEFGGGTEGAYEWIKARILANNIDDIYLGDYLPPFTVEWDGETYEYTPRVWRMGKAVLPGETAYIDFMCDELWFYPIPWNKADYAVGLNIANNPTYGNVVIDAAYLASYLHHCLNGVEGYYADKSGSSIVLAYFTPPAGGDAGENVINLFPTFVRNNIVEKTKYTAFINITEATDQPPMYRSGVSGYKHTSYKNEAEYTQMQNVGKLWLPSLQELLGTRANTIKSDSSIFYSGYDEETHGTITLTHINPVMLNKKRYIVGGNGYTYSNTEKTAIDEPRKQNVKYSMYNMIKFDYSRIKSGEFSDNWVHAGSRSTSDGKDYYLDGSDNVLPFVCFTF